ncbi:MAG: hypothetical protein ACRYG5_03475 [Janthinobacterium lividum]
MPSDKQTPDPSNLPTSGAGVHEKKPDEQVRSRSADPGQSSYGGFKDEDPKRQVQDSRGSVAKKP